jgi:hypothetical protein
MVSMVERGVDTRDPSGRLENNERSPAARWTANAAPSAAPGLNSTFYTTPQAITADCHKRCHPPTRPQMVPPTLFACVGCHPGNCSHALGLHWAQLVLPTQLIVRPHGAEAGCHKRCHPPTRTTNGATHIVCLQWVPPRQCFTLGLGRPRVGSS